MGLGYLALLGWRLLPAVRTRHYSGALWYGGWYYSAGPYVLFLMLHYLWRRRRSREMAWIAVACGALLATWFGWSVRRFGSAATFTSNSSVTMARQYVGSGLARTGANLWDSVVSAAARRANWTAKHGAEQPGFGDWFARHGGRVTFLGDHFAAVAPLAEALVVAGAGLLLRRLTATVSRG
jgi:hypothetical protein